MYPGPNGNDGPREQKLQPQTHASKKEKRKKTEYKIHAPQKPNPSIISFPPSRGKKREEVVKSEKRTREKPRN